MADAATAAKTKPTTITKSQALTKSQAIMDTATKNLTKSLAPPKTTEAIRSQAIKR